MYKIIPFLILFSLFGFVKIENNFDFSEYALGYCVTLNECVNDINYLVDSNGELYHLNTSIKNCRDIKEKYNEFILTETYIIDESDLEEVLNKLKFNLLSKYEVEGVKVLEGYSPIMQKYIKKDFIKYNLQIAISEKVKIGYPYIGEGF